MNFWILILGFTIISLALWDAFVTVFSTLGAGPLTDRWTGLVWKFLLWIHKRRNIHGALIFAGPALLLLAILTWYFLLYAGWFLVFEASPYSVVDTNTQSFPSPPQTLYFVGTALSSLGFGDLTPTHFPWTLLGNLATLSGTVVLTTSLSYLLAVISAAIERRNLASGVFSVGRSTQEFLQRAWGSGPEGPLNQHILRLSNTIDSYAHKHLAYPVLQFFHSKDPDESPALAVLLLSDALFLAGQFPVEERKPDEGLLTVVSRSIDTFRSLAHSGIVAVEDKNEEAPAHLQASTLTAAGIPVAADQDYEASLKDYLASRRILLAICEENGWSGSTRQA